MEPKELMLKHQQLTLLAESTITFHSLVPSYEADRVEPETYKKALNSKDRMNWLKVMDEEMESLLVNMTWTLVDKPKNHSFVECK